MSHFVNIKTRIAERQQLVAALQAMHMQYQVSERHENDIVFRGYQGKTERGEVVVNPGGGYDIGFQRQADGYEMVADWWGVQKDTPLRQESFLQQLHREYAHQTVLDYARERPEMILEWEDRGEERIYELKEKISM